jgi:hypothetical protein
VDVKVSFFRQLIADRKQDLQYLAHVRQRYSESEELIRELSVVLANRFAQGNVEDYPLGMANYSLLVSLEQYLNDDSRVPSDSNIADLQSLYVTSGQASGTPLDQLSADAYLRLVILTRWSFTSIDNSINFETRSKALDVGSLRLPSWDHDPDHPYLNEIPKRDFGTPFDDRLQAGMTGVLHKMRLGDQSISWYRGPFMPCQTSEDKVNLLNDYERGKEGDTYVATDADRLLRYHPLDGMLDISYSSAYELGRFLALRNADYANALYEYKRGRARYITLQKSDAVRKQEVLNKGINIKQLPYAKLDPSRQSEYLAMIKQYLMELATLKDIPGWYLLPDYQLAPQLSIRTFSVDMKWMQSLWLGALSLSGRSEITYAMYSELYVDLQSHVPSGGFFLHSDLVWAYPELVIETKQIAGAVDGTLDVQQLRSDQGSSYADYIERKTNPGREQIQPKPILEARDLALDCRLVLTTDYVEGQVVQYNNNFYVCRQSHRTGSSLAGDGSSFDGDRWRDCPVWTASQRYILNTFVTYEGQAYRCIQDHVSTALFDNLMWEITDDYWQSNTLYEINTCVRDGNEYYISTQKHTSGDSFGVNRWEACASWQAQTDYAQNQFVTYAGQAYQCTQGHASTGSFVEDNWQAVDNINWQAPDDATFNYIALSLPPEALHYGADATSTVVNGETQYSYQKSIKYNGRTVCTLSSTDIQVDDKGIVNIENLAESIKQGLNNSALVDSAYKTGLTHFGSARLSRYMLEGEPKVEFSLGGTK